MASVADIRTYVYGATYDSWNRVQTMTYPDGEKQETYGYRLDGMYEYSIGGDIVTMGQSVFGVKAPGKSVNVYAGWFAGHSIDNFYDYYYGEKK